MIYKKQKMLNRPPNPLWVSMFATMVIKKSNTPF
jgi:hypothetical protein